MPTGLASSADRYPDIPHKPGRAQGAGNTVRPAIQPGKSMDIPEAK